MKKLLIVVGAIAMMYWAYKAGERTAIHACEEEPEEPREKTGAEVLDDVKRTVNEVLDDLDLNKGVLVDEKPGEGEGAGMDDETANFIGMNTNF